jgi:HSP20 family protein
MWGLNDLDRTFDAFDELRRRMDRVFADFDGRGAAPGLAAPGEAPRANVYDTGAELVVEAELPGVAEKDLQLTVTADTLTLAGERKVAIPEGYSVHRRERPGYSFSRSFALPVKVDAEHATANLALGVLTVTLPKAAEVRPRQISVKAS